MSDDEIIQEYEHFWITKLRKSAICKTEVFSIHNNKSFALLGTIKWYGAWRQYCFYPEQNTVWSNSCLEHIREFIKEEMEKRK